MFDVEIKINGGLIGYLYCRNMGVEYDPTLKGSHYPYGNVYKYSYEYYQPEKKLRRGNITHKREEGIEKLIGLIMDDIQAKEKKK